MHAIAFDPPFSVGRTGLRRILILLGALLYSLPSHAGSNPGISS